MSIDELVRHLATDGTGEDDRDDEAARARFTIAAQRADTDPGEAARLDQLAEAVDAELSAYDQGLTALDHGDAQAAQTFLLRALPAGAENTTALLAHLLSGRLDDFLEPDLHQAVAGIRAERLIVNAAYRRQATTATRPWHRSVPPHESTGDTEAGIEDLAEVLLAAMGAKDPYTLHHSRRIGDLVALLGRQIGLSGDHLAAARLGGLLHDIGKLAVPITVLDKTGPLTEHEFQMIQAHVTHGVSIVGHASQLLRGVRETSAARTLLGHALDGILYHHERFDGRGYLRGLAGHDIPEIARLIAVADAFDAMTTARCYRPALPIEKVVAELRRHAGAIFDPTMVEAFLVVLDEHGEQISHLSCPDQTDPVEHAEQEPSTPADILHIIEHR
ncbi:HD-GYP domain-containing protein [Streptosporangium sp. NPDC050855]|uniref:HD-GYP domain-containing protein n=1 Tax=Streptosporangium sp. NPDC050855 TaxID=3366194 RepID=UPI0037AC6E50